MIIAPSFGGCWVKMDEKRRFRALFDDTRAPKSAGAEIEPVSALDLDADLDAEFEREFASTSALSGVFDLIVGLALRFALVVQFYTWARANAQPVSDPFNWRDWLTPSPGLELAAEVWTLGRIDPGLAAFILLAVASLAALSLAVGLFTRVTAGLVGLGALWHMLVIAPDVWPQTAGYLAITLALVLRGGGAASIDWILSRLARFG
jgi:uncharacterized membrane protein YphA (DoxX/SURF4 family)